MDNNDYDYAQKKLKTLIDNSTEMMKEFNNEVYEQNYDPKYIKAYIDMAKSTSEVIEKLVKLEKTKNEDKKVINHIDNVNVIQMTTAERLAKIESEKYGVESIEDIRTIKDD